MRVAVQTKTAFDRAWAAASEAANAAAISESCPELDCVRAWFPPEVIKNALRRAAKLDVGADRVLIAAGSLSEEGYLRALSDSLGVAFEPFKGATRTSCPLNDERLIEAAKNGLLPLVVGNELYFVVAPRGTTARRISRLILENPALARRFRFTNDERLTKFIARHASHKLAVNATHSFRQKWPTLSAAAPRWRHRALWFMGTLLPTFAALGFAPSATFLGLEVALASGLFAWLCLRLTCAFLGSRIQDQEAAIPADFLPMYTVIAALYREASSVDGLLRAIERLDYPHEKLDVIIAIEADDRDTHAAIVARKTRLPLRVIPVAAYGPRTKPKALNVALPFARGTFTVIYDAEDRPEPDQLRRALQAFRTGGKELACVQARLCIDNSADSWLAQLFTGEYAGHFDVFLPGLATLRLPLPLGGSSNHFCTETLREVGGWDPYNVTEDADLGMRLARFGYRTGVIDSTTYEEAPTRLGPWLRQRTRWFKGWIQTWLVHMRQPLRLLHELGASGFITFQLIVGGNVLAALVHPLFLAALIYATASGMLPWRSDSEGLPTEAAFYGATAVIGYLTSAFLGWLGLLHRGLLSGSWVLLLTPLHWLLLSFAAWRALCQFVVAPYTWEKTEHGLAKSSRYATNIKRPLVALERHLTALEHAGELPRSPGDQPNVTPPPSRWRPLILREMEQRRDVGSRATYNAADRLPRLRACGRA